MSSNDKRAESASPAGSQIATPMIERSTERRNDAPRAKTPAVFGRRPSDQPLPKRVMTPPAPAPPPRLDDYKGIVGEAELDTLHYLASELKGKTIKMVNSTAVGGGVAEMLNRLVPLISELEVPTHWEVITGGHDFFEVTKSFHHDLHGGSYELTESAKEIFLRYNEQNRARMRFDEEMVVIHD